MDVVELQYESGNQLVLVQADSPGEYALVRPNLRGDLTLSTYDGPQFDAIRDHCVTVVEAEIDTQRMTS